MAVSVYIPTNSARRFPFLHTLSSIYFCRIFWWWPFWPVWGGTLLWFWFAFQYVTHTNLKIFYNIQISRTILILQNSHGWKQRMMPHSNAFFFIMTGCFIWEDKKQQVSSILKDAIMELPRWFTRMYYHVMLHILLE